MSSQFNVISTFSGCGGSSLGYQLAGGKVRLAVEWDDNAVETYRLNFPGTPIYHGDIAKLSVDECWKLSGLKPGELDIFDGSPPCQGFSTAGKRDMGDSRNQLFREYVRLLRGLQPKVFVMENVSGMVKGKMKLIFVEILKELKASGYKVSARLLNAKYFNVPQSRERMIFIGVRNDLGIEPSHPEAQSKPITASAAIGNIDIGEIFQPTAPKVLKLMGRMKPGDCGTDRGLSTTGFQMLKLHPLQTAGTITKTCTGTWFSGVFHYAENRYLTINEVKTLASFPIDFKFIGKFQEQWARIGNCVPPNFMRAIAEHIRDNILYPDAPELQ